MSKLMIQCLTGNELYVELGSGFREWAYSSFEALKMAEMATGYHWSERVKVNKLGEYLQRDSSVADYFRQNVATWWKINPQLTYMLNEMYKAFRVVVTHEQASALFTEAKKTSRTSPQHLLYLMHLARVSDSSERLIVDNIVKYAAPHLKHMLMIRFNPNRLDYIAHSQELIAWAKEVEDERRNVTRMGRDVVAAIGETRQCFNCGAVGHTQYDCPADVKRSEHADTPSDTKGNNRHFALAVSPIFKARTLCASSGIRCQPC
ncbi:hypothetical protein CCR75_008194 [Bremia lactucae]|uniref:CCHC-type domain-containing protein n=1 Tax=Bremia lactucae TaxID=4779 RepID=A0A976IDW9_BRELC|nr:hypothetical protein CCR75_008194 [Bremia lactucae]